MDQKNTEAHEKLVELYQTLNRPQDSYRQKVKVADLMVEHEDREDARARYEECLKLNNNDNDVRRKLVDIYLQLEETDAAQEETKTLANVYHKERRYEEAIELFDALIEKLPRNLNLREKLSEFYILSDQFDKGLEQLTLVAEEQSRQREWDAAIKNLPQSPYH